MISDRDENVVVIEAISAVFINIAVNVNVFFYVVIEKMEYPGSDGYE